jgi:glycosyltransferase involved in cell wall biosynthesis
VELTVVMPCLNEAETVATCVRKAMGFLAESGISGEVLVADNGSTDGSQQLATDAGARVVPISDKGYGNALMGGIVAARGKYVIMGDADDSYDFTNLMPFVNELRKGADLVMGNRFQGGIAPGAMPPLHKYLGNPVLSLIGRVLFGLKHVKDFHCGIRGFNRARIQALGLCMPGMEFASELVVRASLSGYDLTEVPTTLQPDGRSRPPHLRTWRDGWRHLRFMLMYAPNWLFLGPGGLLAAVGLALVFWLLPGQRKVGNIVFDIHTMFFGMLFVLLGVQAISIGLFAKVFSYSERFDQHGHSLEGALKRVTLEKGLILGALLALLGFAGDVWVFWEWASSGFGPLQQIRHVIFWSLWFFLGLQIIFSSFFLSMLGISRGTYIGDYELKS